VSAKLHFPNLDHLVERYLSGESLLKLARETGADRGALGRALVERGVELRGRSEAERLKWSKLKTDRRLVERQCSAAWKAATGRKHGERERAKHAATVEARGRHRGFYEGAVYAHLPSGFAPEVAVGKYNVDLADDVHRVAVEVVNGNRGTEVKSLSTVAGCSSWPGFGPTPTFAR
jgi:hypothetical protein